MFFSTKNDNFSKISKLACLILPFLAFSKWIKPKNEIGRSKELLVRDSEETKVDGQNRLIIHDLKRQKVNDRKLTLKSTLHTCFQRLDCQLISIGLVTFMLKTVIYERI